TNTPQGITSSACPRSNIRSATPTITSTASQRFKNQKFEPPRRQDTKSNFPRPGESREPSWSWLPAYAGKGKFLSPSLILAPWRLGGSNFLLPCDTLSHPGV